MLSTLSAFWKDPLRVELTSIIAAGAIPLIAVLLFDWNAIEILFVLAWELVAMSAVLWWVLDFPHRSTSMGIARVAFTVLIFGGFLWTLFAFSFGNAGYSAAFLDNFGRTWLAIIAVVVHAVILCQRKMKTARIEGASMQSNDRIGIQWLFAVVLPLCVFLGLLLAGSILGWSSIAVWTLAGVILAKTLVDIGYAYSNRLHERELHDAVGE